MSITKPSSNNLSADPELTSRRDTGYGPPPSLLPSCCRPRILILLQAFGVRGCNEICEGVFESSSFIYLEMDVKFRFLPLSPQHLSSFFDCGQELFSDVQTITRSILSPFQALETQSKRRARQSTSRATGSAEVSFFS